MDMNRFKLSHNFSNVQKKLHKYHSDEKKIIF